jgi:hypothetical protein
MFDGHDWQWLTPLACGAAITMRVLLDVLSDYANVDSPSSWICQ